MTLTSLERAISLDGALAAIEERALELDRSPRFPHEGLRALRDAGALRLPREPRLPPLRAQVALVRALAAVDASTARIVDGHLNGVERMLTSPPDAVAEAELAALAAGELLIGVWGADPAAPGEGSPARIVATAGGGAVLRGEKVFCSGAGGVERALVVAADEQGARRLAYVDVTVGTSVDRDWYRGGGLRSSESHRVSFADAPVLGVIGAGDELLRQPYLARDGVRTAAIWAGLCDRIAAEATAALALGSPAGDPHADAGLGRIRVELRTIDLWLEHATGALERAAALPQDCQELAISTRSALAGAAAAIVERACEACGTRPLATNERLDLARRDLEIFIHQHRLEPALAAVGRAARLAALAAGA